MKTAFMYPGLNGLQRRSDRMRYLHLDEVQQRIQQAEALIAARFGNRYCFNRILQTKSDEIYAVDGVSIAAVIICAIQMGVTDRLLKTYGRPDWLIGCSLGDLARSITSGSYQFDDAIANHVHFTRSINGIDKIGGNIAVISGKDQPFTEADYLWFEKIETDVSVLTPRLLNVGGRFADLAEIKNQSRERGWKVMEILRYPAHSRYIRPYVDRIECEFQSTIVREPAIPVFSSLSARPLRDPKQIRDEFLKSITLPIPWCHSVKKLVAGHGVTRFINVGPCGSLSRIMGDITSSADVAEAGAFF